MTTTSDLAPARRFIDAALRRREAEVHASLGVLCRRISQLQDASLYITRSIADLDSSRPTQQQAAALCLGQYVYRSRAEMNTALAALLRVLDPAAKATVEARRNAVTSLADLACQNVDSTLLLDTKEYHEVIDALTAALDDYSTDQRGDVGSWVRMAGIRALSRVITTALPSNPTDLVPQDKFTTATSAIVKQAMEKLDAVREVATTAWGELFSAGASTTWDWPGAECMITEDGVRLPPAWFSSSLPLLRTPVRFAQVSGLTQSAGIGTSTSSTSLRALDPLVAYLSNSALASPVLGDINALLASNLSSNRITIPGLQTLSRLIEAGIVGSEETHTTALALSTRGLSTIRSIDRLTAALGVVAMSLTLPFPAVRAKAAAALPQLLGHRFPRVRGIAAEKVYLALSEEMDPELEEVLLETTWTGEVSDLPDRVGRLVAAMVD